ncbi:MAG: helix-turn-helix domain-containing protein, partial [Ferruginibacter sp.]
SQRFELSISSLQHLFKKYEDQTYHHYLEETRMAKAFVLITKKGKRINEAMYATGYHNRVTFNIAFKKRFELSPSHFRK